MIRIFVDSGSSIKQEEREKYDVEILPLRILLDGKEYLDGVDLTMEVFYDALIKKALFPKTSLPNLLDAERRVKEYINNGDEVIVLTISSGISGTFNALNLFFEGYENVKVIDSKTAVGGIKILVHEINKYRNETLDFVVDKINKLIPLIRVYAVPETLTYLHRGGRLSKVGFAAGTLLRLKPIIELRDKVSVSDKTIGLKKAKAILVSKLQKCDTNYPIVPSYTYDDANLNDIISASCDECKNAMIEKDNIDPAVACHWGPNAFGFIFVEKVK